MTNKQQDIEKMIAPEKSELVNPGDEDPIEKAVETAKIQAEAKDILSLTVGNLFAFFNLILSPVFVSFAALGARVSASRSTNK